MSEEPKTNSKPTEIGVEVKTREEEEKIRKAKLLDEMRDDEIQKPRELPKRKKPTSQIPETGKRNQEFIVRLDKKYENVNLKVYQGEEIEEDAGNTNIIHDKTEKNTDQISYNFYDPLPLAGKEVNGLTPGKYLIQVHGWGSEFGDELEQEKIVDIE